MTPFPTTPRTAWLDRFDVRPWMLLGAYVDEVRIAGAVVVAEPHAVGQLEGRTDAAILWDVRVAPAWRRRGLVRVLLAAALAND